MERMEGERGGERGRERIEQWTVDVCDKSTLLLREGRKEERAVIGRSMQKRKEEHSRYRSIKPRALTEPFERRSLSSLLSLSLN